MNNHLIFAVSYADALAAAEQLGLEFDQTVWVMNAQLLGSGDYSKHVVHYTESFTHTPAFQEAAAVFGDPRKEAK